MIWWYHTGLGFIKVLKYADDSFLSCLILFSRCSVMMKSHSWLIINCHLVAGYYRLAKILNWLILIVWIIACCSIILAIFPKSLRLKCVPFYRYCFSNSPLFLKKNKNKFPEVPIFNIIIASLTDICILIDVTYLF